MRRERERFRHVAKEKGFLGRGGILFFLSIAKLAAGYLVEQP